MSWRHDGATGGGKGVIARTGGVPPGDGGVAVGEDPVRGQHREDGDKDARRQPDPHRGGGTPRGLLLIQWSKWLTLDQGGKEPLGGGTLGGGKEPLVLKF